MNSMDIVDHSHDSTSMDRRKHANPTGNTALAVMVGRALRLARERGRFTPGDAAALVQVSRAEYERFERGEKLPSVITFCRCAVFLDVSADELLGIPVPSGAETRSASQPSNTYDAD